MPGLPVPLGRRVELPGRGTTFIREVAGPPGAPTLLLLHGWLATGGLNWFRSFSALSRHFNVVAVDLRGHGRGIRSRRRFRLGDCADDAAALLDVLGTRPVIAVGYSLGGSVAQLLWKQHPDKVAGLVLCSTAYTLMPGWREQRIFSIMLAAVAGTTRLGELGYRVPSRWIRSWNPAVYRGRPTEIRRWAAAEMNRHDWRMLLEAGVAMSNFNARRWIGEVDVPTAVVVTTHDHAVAPLAQLQLALAIPHSEIVRVEDGHMVCAKPTYAKPLLEACLAVARRL